MDQTTEVNPFKPLPGYMAMLKLGGNWVTTHFRENVKFSNTSPEMVLISSNRSILISQHSIP